MQAKSPLKCMANGAGRGLKVRIVEFVRLGQKGLI